MRSAPQNRAFSLIELMVSVVLLSAIVIGTMGVMNRLDRKEKESGLRADYALIGQQLDSQFSYDLKNAARINGTATMNGTQFNSTKTFGILRTPFEAPTTVNNLSSDAIQIFVSDPGLSSEPSGAYDVVSLTGTSGLQTMVVSGDFTPTATLIEDLIIAVVSDRTEMFQVVDGSIQAGSTSGQYQFQVNCADSSVCANIRNADPANPVQVYRVQRVVYQVGNGNLTSRGLYRVVNGVTVKVGDDVVSMQVRYELSTTDVARRADCASASKNDQRFFAHPITTSECSWNDIVAIHIEIVLESSTDLGAPQNFNPHAAVATMDGKVRYIAHISKVPTNYTSS